MLDRSHVAPALALTVLVGCGAAAPANDDTGDAEQAAIANGVLFLHFDESAGAKSFKDTSSGAHAVTCSGTACPQAGGIGLFGSKNTNARKRAIELDGSTDCLTVAQSSGLEAALPVTMAFWMLPRSLPGPNKWMAALSKYRDDAAEWMLGVRSNGAGTPRVAFWLGRDGTSSTPITFSTRTLSPSDVGRWMHVVLRIDAAGAYQFTVDDQPAGSGTIATSPIHHGSAPVRIGCVDAIGGAPAQFFHGKLDEIVVAKSWVSNTDVHALYVGGKPSTPKMHLVGGSFVSEINTPIDAATRAELADRVRDLHGDVYRFMIRRDSLCKNVTGENCKDLNAVRAFLAENPDIDVIVDRNPYWATANPAGASATCANKQSLPERWGCALGEMAVQHPNLVGWSIDDFFAERQASTGQWESFVDRAGARAACKGVADALAGSGRTLPISATVYCGWPKHTSFNRPGGYPDMTGPNGWLKNATTQDGELVEYLMSDPVLRSCLTEVALYTHPNTIAASGDPAATINSCLDVLRPLQASNPRLGIIEGVYVSSLAAHPISCQQRRTNVGLSRKTLPDGYSFYQMPAPDDATCPGFSWLGTLTDQPASFVTW